MSDATCHLEQSNRELNDENESLRQQLREADEQCHQQVADAVRSRDEERAAARQLFRIIDKAPHGEFDVRLKAFLEEHPWVAEEER